MSQVTTRSLETLLAALVAERTQAQRILQACDQAIEVFREIAGEPDPPARLADAVVERPTAVPRWLRQYGESISPTRTQE